MERDIRNSVKYAKTATEIWNDLEERFGKESAPKAYELKQQLTTTRQDGSSVSAYYTKLRSIWDEMESVLPTPKCSCDGCSCKLGKRLEELKEKERVYEFLMGLDDQFAVIKTQVLAMKPTPNLRTTYHLVAEDEQQRLIASAKRPSQEATAFQASHQGRRDTNRNFQTEKTWQKTERNIQNNKSEHCSFCGRDGHNRDGCFKRIGYPEWWPGNGKKERSKPKAAMVEAGPCPVPRISEEQYKAFLKLFGGNQEAISNDTPTVANMADPVTIPNGETIPVEGKGVHVFKGGLKIGGVLLVPNFTCNLLSVRRLTKDLNCAVTFFPDFFVLQGLRTGNLIGAGECRDDLYRMGGIKEEWKALAVTVDSWHKRLGHASEVKLSCISVLKGVSLNLKDKVCDACYKAKFTCLPFPASSIKTNACFELIHCDIWGKYRKPSLTEANYFLTIVDDHSREVWVYLLKYKYEASSCLFNFCNTVKTQFSKKVKRIRCDNGGEFVSNQMNNYTEQGNKTPYEMLMEQVPEYDHMRVFGFLVYYRNTETKGDKFEHRGKPGIFLGYLRGSKDQAHDDEFFECGDSTVEQNDPIMNNEETGRVQVESSENENNEIDPTTNNTVEYPGKERPNEEVMHENNMETSPNGSMHETSTNGSDEEILLHEPTDGERPRRHRTRILERLPEAMESEIQALERNGTWTLENLPKGKKPIDSKWVYKVKFKPNGEVDRYKARLVVKGFTQVEGVDYHDNFAPVAKLVTVRTLLAIAVKRGWEIQQLDVNNAFLHGALEEEEASRNWYQKFTTFLIGLGYKQSKADHSMFIYKHGDKYVVALIYVDDVIIVGNSVDYIRSTKLHLDKEFSIKDLGSLKYFLGIEVAKTLEGLVLSQRKYTLDILEDSGLQGCRPSAFPMEPNLKLDKGEEEEKVDGNRYRRLIGRLLYLQATRPDISYSVSVLSQFVGDPRQSHMEAATRVLRYLKSTPGQGILLPKKGDIKLVTYCDSDWLGCPFSRRSRTGYLLLLGGAPISWKSKKQSVVSRSSAEAEYRAIATTVSEILWVRWLLEELDVPEKKSFTIIF
ncbi:hypothetical protein OSB04_030926 [Centaurea solstitialis]|uniref:Integrase catalytic domain-containing protein n=1 Tax=Centaurea solstitialis TaxID=347529 RepID=A0AA38STR9_9ASTR|nr:hypothetical protein OSB04_030926 [Centaurea solstitialis]